MDIVGSELPLKRAHTAKASRRPKKASKANAAPILWWAEVRPAVELCCKVMYVQRKCSPPFVAL